MHLPLVASGHGASGHGALVVLLLVELGLTSHVVGVDGGGSGLKPLSFMLFSAVWSILALGFVAVFPRAFSYRHNLVTLVVLAATATFWLGGSIAVAASLGAISRDHGRVYQATQPSVAVGFVIWALFIVMAALEVLGLLKCAQRNELTQRADIALD